MREHSQVHDAGTSEHGFQPAAQHPATQPAPAESCTEIGFDDDGSRADLPFIVFTVIVVLTFAVLLWGV